MAPPRKKQRLSGVAMAQEASSTADPEISNDPTKLDKPDASETQQEKQNQRRQLFVRSLPATTTTESLTDLFSQSFPVKHAVAVTDEDTQTCKGYGFVTLADAEDAQAAKAQFNGHVLEGKKLRVEVAEPRQREEQPVGHKTPGQKIKEGKAAALAAQTPAGEQGSKLIIRNLPWSVKNDKQLEKFFLSYGKVKSAYLVKKKGGLLAGFGFVTMRGHKNAEKAMAGVNGTEIDGRSLAVDWAVQKDVYTGQGDANGETTPDAGDGADDVPKDVVGGHEDDVDAQDFIGLSGEDGDLDEDLDEDDEELSEGDEDLDDEEAAAAEEDRREDRSSTLFVRNLPFTCTDEDLEDHFSQFGATRYARVVMDQATERSKGTGFVCFYNVEDAEQCLRSAPRATLPPKNGEHPHKGTTAPVMHSVLQDQNLDPTGQYTLDSRVLQITRAVNKSEANRLTSEGVAHRYKRDTDKRRLYLLSEGTIASNTPVWDQLPASEQALRTSSMKQRKQLIESNPSLHLSLTRLSIRNIPRSVSSADLKQLAREAVVGFATDVKQGRRERLSKEELVRGGEEMQRAEKERRQKAKGVVKQAKVVYEGETGGKVNEVSGAGRSRGYGFIEYHTHRSALMGLRWLNGHMLDYKAVEQAKKGKSNAGKEEVAERKKRLIVEFAIENAQVVKRRKEREDKAKEDAKRPRKADDDADDDGERADGAKGGKDKKRKRGADDKDQKSAKQEEEDEKLAKRQRIIQKKRMVRRAKKTGKPFKGA